MKKTMLLLVIVFIYVLGYSQNQYPNPALLYTLGYIQRGTIVTIEPTELPAQVTVGDYLGTYGEQGYSYGTFPVTDITKRQYFAGYADDGTTLKVEGFQYGEVMYVFHYDSETDKFYQLTGKYYNDVKEQYVDNLKCYGMDINRLSNIVVGDEITLKVDADLAKVVFEFKDYESPVLVGDKKSIKINYLFKNTSKPKFTILKGKGRIIGDYYLYHTSDEVVKIKGEAASNFTEQVLIDTLSFIIDRTIASNSIYEDSELIVFIKDKAVYFKGKADYMVFELYYTKNGVEQRIKGWTKLIKDNEVKALSNYTTIKGIQIRVHYKLSPKVAPYFNKLIQL